MNDSALSPTTGRQRVERLTTALGQTRHSASQMAGSPVDREPALTPDCCVLEKATPKRRPREGVGSGPALTAATPRTQQPGGSLDHLPRRRGATLTVSRCLSAKQRSGVPTAASSGGSGGVSCPATPTLLAPSSSNACSDETAPVRLHQSSRRVAASRRERRRGTVLAFTRRSSSTSAAPLPYESRSPSISSETAVLIQRRAPTRMPTSSSAAPTAAARETRRQEISSATSGGSRRRTRERDQDAVRDTALARRGQLARFKVDAAARRR
jgi:hypothetical protein